MGEAVGFHAYGGPDVLRLLHIDVGAPAAGQVRVRVRAAGVNPVDCKLRRGDFAEGGDTFPQRLGNEFAGTVEQVGPGVTGLAPGDDVLGFTVLQAYATAIVVDAAQVVAKPEPLSWPVAGSLSAVGQAAHGAVRELGIAHGNTVLVHGAGGGVGTVAVQLARRAGATVVGTAHPDDADHVRALGAVPVAYGDGIVDRVRAAAPRGVDAALDTAGGEAVAVSVALA
ncbi:alcohol dehydrogenase catalytic domain-containing protein, partial [Saccharomonospora iraqiensis]|uniref:alcohol dehydrogenase catalytic domain-containing protein n=1 Tax=Saccharomonospora iraqiensis TaxID=52698 RepID=UPI00054D0480